MGKRATFFNEIYLNVVKYKLMFFPIQVYMGIDLFYKLPGVPAVRVKPPREKGVRVFIQSMSQGARCVKPGDTILYTKYAA